MRDRDGISILIASIGAALIVRYVIQFVYGSDRRGVTAAIDASNLAFDPLGLSVNAHELTIVVAAIGLMLAMHFMLQRTKLGTAMRAMADNKDLALVTGIPAERRHCHVDHRRRAGGRLGYLYVLLRGTIQFDFGWLLLLLIFAAVILGGIGSVYGAIAGGLVIGIVFTTSTVWIPSDFNQAAAFAVMITMLLLRPEGLFGGVFDRMSDASSPSTDEPPESATAALIDAARQSDLGLVIGTLLLVYLAATLLTFTDGLNSVVGLMRTLTFLGLVYALAALALNLQWGYAGLFNIGVAGFMALGVYTMGIVVRSPTRRSVRPASGSRSPVGIVAGMLVAAVVGLLAALPALRLKADYLAIVTLGMSEIIRLFLQSSTFDTFLRDTLGVGTGGGRGMGLPQNPIRELFLVDGQAGTPTALGDLAFGTFGEDGLGIANTIIIDWAYIAVLAAFVIAFYVLLERLGRSPFGRMLKAIREDDERRRLAREERGPDQDQGVRYRLRADGARRDPLVRQSG